MRIAVCSSVLLGWLGSVGCGIAPERINTECAWTEGAGPTIGSETHLAHDALVAEELSIRYADHYRGFGSGHYAGQGEYAASRDACMTRLVETIAASHDVDTGTVRTLLRRRSLAFDVLVVFVPMALVAGAAATVSVRWVRRRFTPDERAARVGAFLIAFAVVEVLLFQIGSVWSFVAEEELRLHTNHLSYRAFYVPWSQDPIAVVSVGGLIFLVSAACFGAPINRGATDGGEQKANLVLR